MSDLSFFDRITSIFGIIFSSPFFISLLVIAVLTIILLILSQKLKKFIFKLILGLVYLVIIIYIFVVYGKSFLTIGDSIIDQIFKVIYFPSMVAYFCSLLISIILMIMTIISKSISKIFRFCNACITSILIFLSILVIDTIMKNNIDITEKISIYSNESLMILIQASMSIFAIWIFVLIINFIVNLITKKIDESVEKENEGIKLNEDDFKPITNEEFTETLNNYKKKKKFDLFKKL